MSTEQGNTTEQSNTTEHSNTERPAVPAETPGEPTVVTNPTEPTAAGDTPVATAPIDTPVTTAPIESAPIESAPADFAPVDLATTYAEPTVTSTVRRHHGAIQTVGRRKEAVVRIRLFPGTGQFTLNGKSLEQYFPNKVHQQLIREPFVALERADSYDVIGRLAGGGITGQAGALRLALARALVDENPETRPTLKKAGFLTRDARVKERKKYGLKKARKAPQYSKR